MTESRRLLWLLSFLVLSLSACGQGDNSSSDGEAPGGGAGPSADGGAGAPAGGGSTGGGGATGTGGAGAGGAQLGGMAGAPSTCSNGARDGTETGIDCGGECTPCTPATSRVPFLAGRSSDLGDATTNQIVYGDFNGDEVLDIAVDNTANYAARGTNEGTFVDRVYIGDVVLGFALLRRADFNRDGRDDLLNCHSHGTIKVAFGTGDEKLLGTGPAGYTHSGASAASCVVGDFNQDEWPDVAFLDGNPTFTQILLGSDSGFVEGERFASTGPQLLTGNVDGEGGPDLLSIGGGTLAIQLSEGDGSFGATIKHTVPDWARGAVVFPEGGHVVLWGSKLGVATLSAEGALGPVETLSEALHFSAVVGDLDGSGGSEIAALGKIPGEANREFSLYHLDSSWQIYQTLRPSPYPAHPELVDLNGDGLLDLSSAGTNGTVDVLLNLGNGRFPAPPTLAEDKQLAGATFGDLNGDLKPDVVLAEKVPEGINLNVYLNQASGLPQFVEQQLIANVHSVGNVIVADVLGDEHADVITSGSLFHGFAGDGTGQLSPGPSEADFEGGIVTVADVTGDGTPEMISVASQVYVYEAGGDWFSTTPIFTSAGAYKSLHGIMDVDDNGIDDIVLGYEMTWIPSLGDGAFGEAQNAERFGSGYTLLEGGAAERRWAYCHLGGLHVLRQSASGDEITPIGGPYCSLMIRADWNRDGIMDLITGGEVLALYEGHADGSLTFTELTLLSGDNSTQLAYFDATGDGLEDIVVVNVKSPLTILAGTP